MWLNISGQGLTVDAAVCEQVKRRLGFALGKFKDRIGRVTVHLTDWNGPQGGEGKQCRMVVDVLGHARVMVEDTDRDVQVAINRTADRVEQAVRRKLDHARLSAELFNPKSLAGQNSASPPKAEAKEDRT
ncbi:hypothetical protein BH11PLA2_BH11PLA2_49130 [soil metagenome]